MRPSSPAVGASPASSAARPSPIDEMKGQVNINGQRCQGRRLRHDQRHDRRCHDRQGSDRRSRRSPAISPTLMTWADKVRTLKVRTNADTPEDAVKARSFGAEGIGLCRTEHMFFEGQRIVAMRKMILADDEEGRKKALAGARSLTRSRTSSASSRRWTACRSPSACSIPPLHEFLPHDEAGQGEVAHQLGIPIEKVKRPGRGTPRGQPDARPPRLPPADHVPRDRRHAGPGDHRGRHRGAEEGQERPARDHDPADRHRRGADLPQEAGDRPWPRRSSRRPARRSST